MCQNLLLKELNLVLSEVLQGVLLELPRCCGLELSWKLPHMDPGGCTLNTDYSASCGL